jgi:KamA family protein
MRVVTQVLPFRVNNYVIDQLIDWNNIPDDPIYQLTFPQQGMLSPDHFTRIADLVKADASRETLHAAVNAVHMELNPHPADQLTLNVPQLDGKPLPGIQHKYRETVLFYPSQGQTCHSYCTFCFRWPQFVGNVALRIASRESQELQAYLKAHPQVTDVLLTGGDPMVMKASHLAAYLEPLLQPEFAHIKTIRIGSKSLTFWPYRYVTDKDADSILRLFERVVAAGKQLAFMAHFNHWREMETAVCLEAIRRIRDTGAVIRTQAPLLKHINDDVEVWTGLWRKQVRLGLIPYYMFVVRDTGARCYFEVPLSKAWEIYRGAMQQLSGLGRTARGPSMSTGPGKVEMQGISQIKGEKVFVLRFIQGRNPDWVQRPFFAKYDPEASWLDQLVPAFDDQKFFYQEEYDAMRAHHELA